MFAQVLPIEENDEPSLFFDYRYILRRSTVGYMKTCAQLLPCIRRLWNAFGRARQVRYQEFSC
jgi:hypothetical protein